MAVILIAEDDQHIIRVVTLWLNRNGHTVCEAHNGREAVDRLRQGGIDLLITDVNMPVMTGMEVLEAAAGEGVLPRGVVILSSRCDQREIAAQAEAYGGEVHPKPFSPSRLIRLVEEKLAGSTSGTPLTSGTQAHE